VSNFFNGTVELDECAPALAYLHWCGVASVTVTFDGSGDSGNLEVEEPVLADRPGVVEPVDGFYDALETAVESVLPGGWEINEGAQGEVTFHVDAWAAGGADCEAIEMSGSHNDEYEDSDLEEEDGPADEADEDA
jgi:hypothetical protein